MTQERASFFIFISERVFKAALSQIDCSDNFYICCLGMRQILRKCLGTSDIRLLTKDQISVFHIYVRKLMFYGQKRY